MKTKIIRRVILAFTLVLTFIFLLTHYDKNEYARENLEAYVQRMGKLYDVQGLSAAIIDGENEYFINYGNDKKNPIDENSLFELASTTKSFTGLAIMQLEDAGLLSLSDSVTKYLPWFRPTYKNTEYDITIENLMCHTSGIPAWTISAIPAGTKSDDNLLEKTIQNIKDVKLDSLPGSQQKYATINFDVLALILEEITGQKYEDYVTENILKPLGMHNSFFRTNDEDIDKIVQGYRPVFMRPKAYNAPTYYGNTAAGYLVSSTSDLMKWMKHWGVNSKDNSGLVVAMLNHDVSKSDGYFGGWWIYDDFITHGGNNPNFSTQVIISREKNQAVFVLSNIAGSSGTMTADGIYRILLGENIKIGLHFDIQAIYDFLCIIFILLLIYFVLLFRNKKSKKDCIVRITISVIIIIAAIVLPLIFHYPYNIMFVWFPLTAILAVIFVVCLAVFNLYTAFRHLR